MARRYFGSTETLQLASHLPSALSNALSQLRHKGRDLDKLGLS